MDLSIIVINFNTVSITCECLDSIKRHLDSSIVYELILVDNAAKVSNESVFKNIIPELTYLRFEANLGFGVANNRGMEIATGDYFLLLNSDTLLFDDSIQKCISFIRQAENFRTGVLGCKLLNEDRSYQSSFYPFVRKNLFNYFISNNPLLSRLFYTSKSYREPMTTLRVGDVSGAFMLLKREVYQTTGGFDPDFFLYCEETEWCRNRICKHFDIIYYPHASVIHLGGKSAPGELMYVQAQLSLALYWYKSGLAQYLLYIVYNYINCVFFLVQYYLTNSAGKLNIKKCLNGFVKIQKYLFFDIPTYKRHWGARNEPLVLEEAKMFFSGDRKTD